VSCKGTLYVQLCEYWGGEGPRPTDNYSTTQNLPQNCHLVMLPCCFEFYHSQEIFAKGDGDWNASTIGSENLKNNLVFPSRLIKRSETYSPSRCTLK